jgi:type IV secretory pathway TraG/TraD family ATPase VirD4
METYDRIAMASWHVLFWVIGSAIAAATVAWNALPADLHPAIKVLVILFGTVAVMRGIALVLALPRYWLSSLRLRLGSPYGKAAWARLGDLRQAGMLKPGGLFLGQWRGWFRRADLFRHGEGHLLTIAAPGAGKTTGLVIPALLSVEHGAVIVTDPKAQLGTMTARHRATRGEVFFLNPFADDLKTIAGIDLPDSGFNPIAVLEDGINLVDDARSLARLLMVTDRRESGSYWNDESAALLAALLVWMVRKEPPELRTLTFLWSIVREGPEAMEQRLEWMAGLKKDAYLRAEGERLLGLFKVPPQWQGVISKAQLATDRYSPDTPLGIHTAKTGPDLRRLKREDITIYLLVPTGRAKVAAPWLNLLMGVFGIAVAKPGPARPVYLLMDEAPALGYLPDLRNHLREGREAGLRAWIFSQTRAAMADPDLYGDTGFRDIMGLCETKAFFSIGERDLAQEISDMVGQKTATNRSRGENGRESVSTVGVPLLRPEDILRLPKGQMVVLRGEAARPIRARLVPYWTRPAWAAATDANPYRSKAP